MMKDLLTKNLVYKEIKRITVPTAYSYDNQTGLWRSADRLFVDSPEFEYTAYKKRDIETSEDQK